MLTPTPGLGRRVLRRIGLAPMAHRPPLERRFWWYCLGAYAAPIAVQLGVPNDPALYDELSWLVTLVPAFLLSLHFGLRGALASLVVGAALFVAVQLVLALAFTADDWRITVPVFVAYSALAISVGWLSQQLHDHYSGKLESARLEAVGQVAVTVRHEVNNELMTIVAQSQRLAELETSLTEAQRDAASEIHAAAKRIAADIRKLSNLSSAPLLDPQSTDQIIDLERARER